METDERVEHWMLSIGGFIGLEGWVGLGLI